MTIAAQIGRSAASMEASQRAKDFCTLARIIALSKGECLQAQRVLREPRNKILLGNTARSVIESAHGVWTFDIDIRQKAAVAAGTTADSGWALPLAEYDLLATAFLESLKTSELSTGCSRRCVAFRCGRGSVRRLRVHPVPPSPRAASSRSAGSLFPASPSMSKRLLQPL